MDLQPRAIIFDLDGVIVDSEPLHAAALAAVCKPRGVPFDGPRFVGWSDDAALRAAFSTAGIPFSESLLCDLLELKTRRYLESVRVGRVKPYPGVIALLRALGAAGVPLGLCSAAMRSEIDATLQALGLSESFRAIIGFEDAAPSKPAPAPYRAITEALGIDPAACLAIEDSPHGVTSARDAGLTVCAVLHTKPAEALSHAHSIHPTIAALAPTLLDRLAPPASARG